MNIKIHGIEVFFDDDMSESNIDSIIIEIKKFKRNLYKTIDTIDFSFVTFHGENGVCLHSTYGDTVSNDITINVKKDILKILATLRHEIGHVIFYNTFSEYHSRLVEYADAIIDEKRGSGFYDDDDDSYINESFAEYTDRMGDPRLPKAVKELEMRHYPKTYKAWKKCARKYIKL